MRLFCCSILRKTMTHFSEHTERILNLWVETVINFLQGKVSVADMIGLSSSETAPFKYEGMRFRMFSSLYESQ